MEAAVGAALARPGRRRGLKALPIVKQVGQLVRVQFEPGHPPVDLLRAVVEYARHPVSRITRSEDGKRRRIGKRAGSTTVDGVTLSTLAPGHALTRGYGPIGRQVG